MHCSGVGLSSSRLVVKQQPPSRAGAPNAAAPARCALAKSARSSAQTVTDTTDRRNAATDARHAALEAQREAQVSGDTLGQPWWETDCPRNMVNVLSLAQLQDAVEREPTRAQDGVGRLVVVNFFAPECYACKSLQPKLRQIAANNPDVLFLKVNGLEGDLQAYCEDMGITRIPYFHFYRANKRVAAFAASLRPEKLALLRAEIAAHKPQPLRAADTPSYAALEA